MDSVFACTCGDIMDSDFICYTCGLGYEESELMRSHRHQEIIEKEKALLREAKKQKRKQSKTKKKEGKPLEK